MVVKGKLPLFVRTQRCGVIHADLNESRNAAFGKKRLISVVLWLALGGPSALGATPVQDPPDVGGVWELILRFLCSATSRTEPRQCRS